MGMDTHSIQTGVFYAGLQLQHEPHLAVTALAAYIQVGCSREAVLHPAPGSRLVQQVLAIGHKLIQLHQTAHIHQLLALAGDAADTLGGAFLKVTHTPGVPALFRGFSSRKQDRAAVVPASSPWHRCTSAFADPLEQ